VENLEASRRQSELSMVSGIEGVYHSLEESHIHEFERDLGYLSTWFLLSFTQSIVFHIYWSDWTSLAEGLNC
jgi:hypothetical protein